MSSNSMSAFALTVLNQKYAHDKPDGAKESWEEIAQRVARNVLKAVNAPKSQIETTTKIIAERKFIPGGRYLYAAGRPFHQVQNCLEGSTRTVTRNGVKTLAELAGTRPTLMTNQGRWVEAEVRSFGRQKLAKLTLVRQGVEKVLYPTWGHSWRVALNTGKGRPINKVSRDTSDLRPGDKLWQVFGYGISRTPVSPAGIQHGIVYGDGNVPKDEFGFNTANIRLCGEKNEGLICHFQGYERRDLGGDLEISGLPRRYKQKPSLAEDRSYLLGWLAGYFAADGCVSKEGTVSLASADRDSLEFVREVCYLLGIGTFGIRSNERISNLTDAPHTLYSIVFMRDTLMPEFFLIPNHRRRYMENPESSRRTFWNVVSVEETDREEEVYCALVPETHEFVLEDNILTGNCLLLRAGDSREDWADLLQKSSMALMTGAGIGVDYSEVRCQGSKIRKTGGVASGPTSLMKILNEVGRGVMQGGSRRSAIWAGLRWSHKDATEFATMKNWSPEIRALKEKDFNFPAPMDMTNISVILDAEFFKAYHNEKHKLHSQAHNIYWLVVRQMLKTAEPGFSIDVEDSTESLRNACTEVTSRDDSDICNLGSINMARIASVEEMRQVTELATSFLLAGTVYSDVPYAKVDSIRTKNRRLGLGLMGLHEWMLLRGQKYGPSEELAKYLDIYATSTAIAAQYADRWDLSAPVKTRAIAPTGTIGIVGKFCRH